jgi:uncharacterized membrane protein
MTPLFVIAIVMIIMDTVYLTSTAPISRSLFASIQGSPLNLRWPSVVVTYILMILGVWYFAVSGSADWKEAAMRGAALGALVYGVYDFTNYATLSKYTLSFAAMDMAWGTLLFATSAAIAKVM